jgi:hypothetical protein
MIRLVDSRRGGSIAYRKIKMSLNGIADYAVAGDQVSRSLHRLKRVIYAGDSMLELRRS